MLSDTPLPTTKVQRLKHIFVKTIGAKRVDRGSKSCEIWTVIRVEYIGQNINVIIGVVGF